MHEHLFDQTYWLSILLQSKFQIIDVRLGERATNICTANNSIATQITQICFVMKRGY